MRRALLSLYDKHRSCEVASFLYHRGYNIISSGGTYAHLKKNKIENLNKVEDITKFPEILEGRVKTLHPNIFGGILSDVYNNNHSKDLLNNKIHKIDVIIANLYPFEKTVSKTNNINDIIEEIDIGGHALLRASAKNYKDNIVIYSESQYDEFMNNYQSIRNSTDYRREFARKAFNYVTEYDIAISNYFNSFKNNKKKYYTVTQKTPLKYGSNPQQKNASIVTIGKHKFSQMPFKVLNGNIGYINTLDAIYSWQLVKEITDVTGLHCAASFKHTSPAGVSIVRPLTLSEREVNFVNDEDAKKLSENAQAYILARGTDPKSSFGDFVAISGHVDLSLANRLKNEVSDGIIAQTYSKSALEILSNKKNGRYVVLEGRAIPNSYEEMKIFGNFGLVQENNNTQTIDIDIINNYNSNNPNQSLSKNEILDMQIANTTLKYAQSNAVSLVKNGTLLGIGVGQQSRIDCVKLACNKALVNTLKNHTIVKNIINKFKKNTSRQAKINAIIKYIENDFTVLELNEWQEKFVEKIPLLTDEQIWTIRNLMNDISMASDGFLPFSDNIDLANKYGIKNIIQPGGSVNDHIVREKCNDYNIRMIETGIRNFFH